jgi:hypothetical protein
MVHVAHTCGHSTRSINYGKVLELLGFGPSLTDLIPGGKDEGLLSAHDHASRKYRCIDRARYHS